MNTSRSSKRNAALLLGALTIASTALSFVGPTGAQAVKPAGSRAGLSSTGLAKEMHRDPSLEISTSGKQVYADLPDPKSGTNAPTSSAAAPLATSSTFTLHSKPTSIRKIYLDFTGHAVAGTAWNTDYNQGAAFTASRFDLDGNPSTISAAEHAAIQRTYLRVREDFEPFDVDVTTEEPGVEALRKSSSTDAAYGIRVVFTPTNIKGCDCGGYAYYSSFSWNTDTPAFVLTDSSSGDKFMGEAASHEVGHSVGLRHDGNQTATGRNEYYTGHANWAPIMGVGYYRTVSQWSKGEYAGATNTEDDFATMQANGLNWAADDVAGTTATNSVLKDGLGQYATIGATGDVDTYRVSFVVPRTFKVKVWNATTGVDANLNARVIVKNAAGTTVATASPTTSLGVDATITVQPGTYYVSVDGVGEGSSASTGYTRYGSMGRYGIQLNIV